MANTTDVVKETTKRLAYGVKAVGTTAGQLTTVKVAGGLFKGILLKCPGASDDTPNTKSVFVGGTHVTADQAATGGFPLAPGESISLPIDAPDSVYVRAVDANQKINWIMM